MNLALTLHQPWASLVVGGAKEIETRSWATKHRGRLLIHAAKAFPAEAVALCDTEPFRSALAELDFDGWEQLPRGALLGSVMVDDCVPTEQLVVAGGREQAFGDYSPNRWAWLLCRAKRFATPVPMRGYQRLWRPRFTT